ncbi:MAG: hypothetical protein WCH65_05345 [bacterium]
MKEKTKQRKKNITVYVVCLLVSITMWIGLKYNLYIEEKIQIKKICQIEKQAKESQKKEETPEEKKTKKIPITKKEEKKVPDNILPDTIEKKDTLIRTTESQ